MMIHEANMTLMDGQHYTWFVASRTPHLRMALSQQNLSTQAEALEMVMRLHETPIQDPGLGIQQIHMELQNLSLEMQSLKQDRTPRQEAHEEVWCIKFKGRGHDKDHCLVFVKYLAQTGLSTTPTLSCTICEDGNTLWIIFIYCRSICRHPSNCFVISAGR